MRILSKTNLFKFSAIFFALTLAFLCAETALRLLLPIVQPSRAIPENDSLLQPNTKLGITYRPNNKLGTDSNGFRNKEVLDSYDIVALGDSHTVAGFEYPSWPEVLSEISGTSVYNMGVHGYGPAQYYALLDKALSFRPKLVVVALYTANDLFDAYDTVYHRDGWEEFMIGEFIDTTPTTMMDTKQIRIPLKNFRDFLRDHSVLYGFIGDRTRIWREKLGFSTPRYTGTDDWNNGNPDASLLYDKNKNLKTLFWGGHRLPGVNLEDKKVGEGQRLTFEFMSLMEKKAGENGAKLLVALIPSKFSAYGEEIGELAGINFFYREILKNEGAIRSAMARAAERDGYYLVDTTPFLQEALKQGTKLYPESMDEHPLAAGYAKYAEVIANYIKENNLIDQPR